MAVVCVFSGWRFIFEVGRDLSTNIVSFPLIVSHLLMKDLAKVVLIADDV